MNHRYSYCKPDDGLSLAGTARLEDSESPESSDIGPASSTSSEDGPNVNGLLSLSLKEEIEEKDEYEESTSSSTSRSLHIREDSDERMIRRRGDDFIRHNSDSFNNACSSSIVQMNDEDDSFDGDDSSDELRIITDPIEPDSPTNVSDTDDDICKAEEEDSDTQGHDARRHEESDELLSAQRPLRGTPAISLSVSSSSVAIDDSSTACSSYQVKSSSSLAANCQDERRSTSSSV